MNETLKTLLNRRSIRAYKQGQIKDEELQAILEAGKYAPSAMNQQSWHISAVQNKEMLHRINEAVRDFMAKSGNKSMEERVKAENFSVFYDAPTLIVVSGDETAIAPVNDCTLALENMFLAAASMSIGSCWIHAIRALSDTDEGKAISKELGIPEGYRIVCSGAFGYGAAGTPAPAPRKEGTVTILK